MTRPYVSFRVTLRQRRKKMPEAILKALKDAGMVHPEQDAAVVIEDYPVYVYQATAATTTTANANGAVTWTYNTST